MCRDMREDLLVGTRPGSNAAGIESVDPPGQPLKYGAAERV
jgi:hypothetical protein